MTRPTLDRYFMSLAYQISSRATCQEAQVGAILVSSEGHILATGYNGSLPKQPECIGKPNCKLTKTNSVGQLSFCPTIHAEANALNQFRSIHGLPFAPSLSTIYVTTHPCLSCLQLLIQAKVHKVVYGSLNSWAQLSHPYQDQIHLKYYPLDRHEANLLA